MSDNVRVYEIAEEAGATSAEVMAKAKDLKIELKSAQSTVSYEDAEEIAIYIMTGKSAKLEKKPTTKKPIVKKLLTIEKSKPVKLHVNSNLIFPNKPIKLLNDGRTSKKHVKIVSKRNTQVELHNRIKTSIDLALHPTEPIEITEIIRLRKEIEFLEGFASERNKLDEIIFHTEDMILQNEKIKNNQKSEKITDNSKRTDFPINSYPEVIIEIENLKTIKYLKWELQQNPGVYAIIGENGSGKSSLLISIAKLIEPLIFHHELTGTGYYDKTKITYTINGKEFTWVKNQSTNNNWRQGSQDKVNMPSKLKGFFESSILTGTRFDKVDEYIKDELDYREEDIVTAASDFIKSAMNYVLFGNRKLAYKFDKLFKVDANRKRKNNTTKKGKITYSSRDYSYYALNLQKDEYIKEHLFSTGEYFLLQLLKFIDSFKNNGGSVIPALIIIDEVELSLHPLAQTRLTEQLKTFAQKFKLVILFASHSLHILENISAKNTFFIQKNVRNDHVISNPIHLGYLTSKLYKHQFYDKVILVEDDLAKLYIEHTLNDMPYHDNLSVGVIIVGGSSQVVKAAIENHHEKFYGSADVMVSLDEDKKKDAYGKQQYFKWSQHIPVPKNIENYVSTLIVSENHDFINFVESIMIKKSFHELNIKTTGQKTGFTTLVAEIAGNVLGRHHNNKENAKDYARKEIISYVYCCHKGLESQTELTTELIKLFNGE